MVLDSIVITARYRYYHISVAVTEGTEVSEGCMEMGAVVPTGGSVSNVAELHEGSESSVVTLCIKRHGVCHKGVLAMNPDHVKILWDWNARSLIEQWREDHPNERLDFSDACLGGLRGTGYDLSKANFSGANLRGAALLSAKLVDADLRRANLSGAPYIWPTSHTLTSPRLISPKRASLGPR